MGLWVRSQDRNTLVESGEFTIREAVPSTEWELCYNENDSIRSLGIYTSQVMASYVLDLLQKQVKTNTSLTVYEMPSVEEVNKLMKK